MPRQRESTSCFRYYIRRTPSWRCSGDWCTQVNDLGRVLENSMTCLQSCVGTGGFFPCKESTNPSKRRHATLPLVDCYVMVSLAVVTLIKKTDIPLGFMDCQDGPSPRLRGRWEWMLRAEFGSRNCSKLRINGHTSILREQESQQPELKP
jgi:hypothetical protein